MTVTTSPGMNPAPYDRYCDVQAVGLPVVHFLIAHSQAGGDGGYRRVVAGYHDRRGGPAAVFAYGADRLGARGAVQGASLAVAIAPDGVEADGECAGGVCNRLLCGRTADYVGVDVVDDEHEGDRFAGEEAGAAYGEGLVDRQDAAAQQYGGPKRRCRSALGADWARRPWRTRWAERSRVAWEAGQSWKTGLARWTGRSRVAWKAGQTG